MAAIESRQRRLAIVAPSAGFLHQLGTHLIYEAARRGHQVFYFSPARDNHSLGVIRMLGGHACEWHQKAGGYSPVDDERSALRLRAAFQDIRPHAMLAVSMKAAIAGTLAARLAHVRHIVPMLMDGCGIFRSAERRTWAVRQALKPVWWAALRASHGLIVPAPGDRDMLEDLGVLPSNLPVTCVAAPGADLGHVGQLPLPPLDRGALFYMTADLRGREGVLDYCEAAWQLRARAPHVRCLLAGKAAAGRDAVPLTELRRFRPAIQYLGPREDAIPLISRCHVLVMPARAHGEDAGALLSAALAMGRPIIAADSPLAREAVEHGVNGFLVPPGNAAALARAMAQMLMRPDLIPYMAEASREIAERSFDIRAVTEAVLEALRL